MSDAELRKQSRYTWMLVAFSALVIFLMAQQSRAQTTNTLVMQDANFATQFNSGGDFFNNGSTELGMWANSGSKQTAGWANFGTSGFGGTARQNHHASDRNGRFRPCVRRSDCVRAGRVGPTEIRNVPTGGTSGFICLLVEREVRWLCRRRGGLLGGRKNRLRFFSIRGWILCRAGGRAR